MKLRDLFAFILCLCPAFVCAGGPTVILQPVPPKTVPPSNYPPGTTIVGQEIILGSVPARVWLEMQATGFPTTDALDCLKTIQIRVDASDNDMDGGGYYGANADCTGSPAVGAGDINNVSQQCANTAVCRQTMSGRTGPCFAGEPDPCSVGFCSYLFQDLCDPEWICTGIYCIPAADIGSNDARCGATVDDTPDICLIDFSPSYVGTVVIEIPANAKGSYTLDFNEAETYMQNGNPWPDRNIPIENFLPAIITVPCGACCLGYTGSTLECVDHVVESQCVAGVDQVFTADELCPANGGAACPACASSADCNDGIACTVDQCTGNNDCTHAPTQANCDDGLFCNGLEFCDLASGCIDGPIPCDANLCDEAADECRAGIPTVSNWGLVILILALLIAAKLRYGRAQA